MRPILNGVFLEGNAAESQRKLKIVGAFKKAVSDIFLFTEYNNYFVIFIRVSK